MNNAFRAILTTCVLLISVCAGSDCAAQALPDTSLNHVIPDSLVERKEAQLQERTRVTSPAARATVREEGPIVTGPFQPKPKKSTLYAAILPGSGQIYNRQYWKVPVVYGLVAVGAYFLVDNTTNYRKYRKAYVSRLTNPAYEDEFTGLYSESTMLANLQQRQDEYKKYLDLTYLLTGVGYILQVVDALAFAHLKNFDVSPNLSMRTAPIAAPNGGIGIGLIVAWK